MLFLFYFSVINDDGLVYLTIMIMIIIIIIMMIIIMIIIIIIIIIIMITMIIIYQYLYRFTWSAMNSCYKSRTCVQREVVKKETIIYNINVP